MRAGFSCSEWSKADSQKQHLLLLLLLHLASSAFLLQMAKMNFSVAALVLFLVAAFFLQAQAQPGRDSNCCFSYTKSPIPLKRLVSYEVRSRCSLPAVVFFTVAKKQVCADPQQEWTQQRMSKLQENGQQK